MNNKKNREEIEKYLSYDIDVLFSTISLIESSKNENLKFLPGNEVEKGKKIFKSLEEKLYYKICVEFQFCKKKDIPKYSDQLTLGCAIIDLISGLTIGIPAAVIVAILLKMGLSKFCGCKK